MYKVWQELCHWSFKFTKDITFAGQGHAGFIGVPPAINQRKQGILGEGRSFHLKMVEVNWPYLLVCKSPLIRAAHGEGTPLVAGAW